MKIHDFLLALLLSALLFTPGCRKAKKGGGEKKVRVTTQRLTKQLFRQRIPIKGIVSPIQYASISAKAQGTLDDVKVTDGSHVRAGELLCSIDRLTLEDNVTVKQEEVLVAETECATAEIELQLARTREEKAAQDFTRSERLLKSKATSLTSHESADVALKAARALVQKSEVAVRYRKAKLVQAKTGLRIARKDLKDAMVIAPFDCIVTEKLHEQGEYVKVGEVLLKLENVKNLQIVAYLSAVYHPKIREGVTPVVISVDGIRFGEAKVTYRAETIDPETRTFKIKAKLPPDTQLSSGMLCNLDIVLAESEGYGVPESAVLQRGEKYFVFTVNKDLRAERIAVRRGILDGAMCQIANPAALKDKAIVVTGQRFLNNGDRVLVAK